VSAGDRRRRRSQKMLDEWPDRQIIFFDDSMRHIRDACSIENERLTVVYVEWPTCKQEASDMRDRVIMNERTCPGRHLFPRL
jgi:hypothetical protein